MRSCEVDDCDRPHEARGLCHGHLLRLLRGGDVQADVPLRRRVRRPCSIGDCERPAHARGYCQAHYKRWLTRGDPGADTPLIVPTNRGRSISHGYVRVQVPADERHLVAGSPWELEHRLVMARHLGRPLASDESVHHKNGDRQDNRLANLELWGRWQPSGQRAADLLATAVGLVARYAPHRLSAVIDEQAAPADELRTTVSAPGHSSVRPARCRVVACDRDPAGRGLCTGHYARWYRTGDVHGDVPLRTAAAECAVPDCRRSVKARHLCRAHYARTLACGDPRPDQPIRRVTRQGSLSHGYAKVPVPTEDQHLVGGATQELEHRLVMARSLGRPLRPDESVHHKNGDRLDNRLENLELWGRWQPSGQRVADLLRHALAIIRRNSPEHLVG